MKKVLLIALCVLTILCLVACSEAEKSSKKKRPRETEPSESFASSPEASINNPAGPVDPTGATDPVDPTHQHTYNNGVVTLTATCTEKGIKTYTCTKCGESKTEELEPTGHHITGQSCTTPGTCSNCNAVFEPLKHNYVNKTCTICGDYSPVTINNDIFPLAEPVVFRIAVRGEKDYQALMERCLWYKYLCEKTNVYIECVVLGSDYVGRLNTLITTGNAPDAVLGPITLSSAQVVDLAECGLLHPLEDYITDSNIMPNYQRLLQATPLALNKMTAPDGHIWSVANLSIAPGTAWESPLSVNIDWLKQVPGYEDGKTFPRTVAEFTDVLRYFKAHDMNGNGNPNDEIPFLMVSSSTSPGDAQGTLQGLMNLWGLSTKDGSNEYYVHITDNGRVTLAPTTENYRDCLRWVNLWYEEGLLWNCFFDQVTSRDFAAVHGNSTAKWGFFNGANWYNNGSYSNPSQPWGDAQTLVEPFDTGYDVRYFVNPTVLGSLNAFTIFDNCEHPEILLAWYDQFLSLEGTLVTYNGMPNENTSGTANTTWASIFNANAVFKGVTPKEYTSCQYPNHSYSEAIVLGQWMEDHPEYFDHYAWPRPYYTLEESEMLTWLWPDVSRVIQDWEYLFITGQKSLDSDWYEFQRELQDAGSEELIEVLQAAWNRVKPS